MNELGEHADETTIEVGKQIRMLRDQRNLSQQALADASGISRNTLSLIERGQTSPTVSTLKSLARALAVNINAFFQPFNESSVVFTKADQRPHLQLDHGALADLGLGMPEQVVTPLLLRLDPGASSGEPLAHDGQDFIFCLSGALLYLLDGRGYLLEPGDSLLFDGRLPHRFRNASSEAADVLIILSTAHDSTAYINGHFPKENQQENQQ